MFSKKIHLYGGNFNTSSLYNQKVYVNHIKRSKAKGLGAIRPQRRKNFWLGKIFFSFLHEFGYSDSFAKISFFDLYEGHKAKIFHCLQNNFFFPSIKQIKIWKLYSYCLPNSVSSFSCMYLDCKIKELLFLFNLF